jgi:hypothetical protein
MAITTTDQVRALLDLAGVVPSDAELADLITGYPDMKASIDRLWALDLGESVPALVFDAAGTYGPEEVSRG